MRHFQTLECLKKTCFAGCAALFIFLYIHGALEHSSIINLDVNQVDQAAYLSYARNMYETSYNSVGGRNRMPVYSFLLSLIYSPHFAENEFFTRSKCFNIALSAALLPSLFWLFRSRLTFIQTVNLWLITIFTVFIFRAGYAQAELLFYLLNFCSFLLMFKMLQKPSWKLGILTGSAIGITHLTKASTMPGLLLFVLFFIAKEIHSTLSYRVFNSKNVSHNLHRFKQNTVPHLLSLTLAVLVFLGMIYPYISTSQRFFGQYFYNVNSTFYIWYDSWEEAEAGTRMHGDGKGWPEMPPEMIPSPKKYLREHTAQQILRRFVKGIGGIFSVAYGSYGYFKYVLLYVAIALLISILNLRSSIDTAKKHIFLIGFCLTYFVAYLLLYAWYFPIAGGNRYTLSLFMPLMFFLGAIAKVQFNHHPFIKVGQIQLRWFYFFNLLILGMILFEIPSILTYKIITVFSGS